MPAPTLPVSNVSVSTEKILVRLRAALSFGLLGVENFQSLMDSNSGDMDELRRVASSLVASLSLIDDSSGHLDISDPTLLVPRDIVSELASQTSTGDASISELLTARKSAATAAIEVGVSQSNALAQVTSNFEQLLISEGFI